MYIKINLIFKNARSLFEGGLFLFGDFENGGII